jgi:hypothetical protein
VINLINAQGASVPVDQLPPPPPYYDVNGNGFVDSTDVLSLIDHINSTGGSGSGEGESSDSAPMVHRFAVGVLAAPSAEVVAEAIERNTVASEAVVWSREETVDGLYGPSLFPVDSDDEEAKTFWSSFATTESDEDERGLGALLSEMDWS